MIIEKDHFAFLAPPPKGNICCSS